uniref:hypothetical protein n=1 Tax=Photorhabdus sp. RM322S TaxID=3342825 RepID=UPI0036DA54EE
MNIEVSMPYKSNRFDQAKLALAKEGQASIRGSIVDTLVAKIVVSGVSDVHGVKVSFDYSEDFVTDEITLKEFNDRAMVFAEKTMRSLRVPEISAD